MKKRLLITGANGQLGMDLVHLVDHSLYEVLACTKAELDITNDEEVNETFKSFNPDWVLHAAAYTNVEAAEGKEKELNWLVNAKGTENVAKAANKVDAKMIYISTDYVFDGTKETEYETDDIVNPLNEYGKAKQAGEKFVQNILGDKGYIIRTSWVFGINGNNFVYTMLSLAKEKKQLNIIADQFGRPTFSLDLAKFILFLTEKEGNDGGIYHFSNKGSCSWYEFSKEILKNNQVVINPVSTDSFNQKAMRPKNSILQLSKSEDLGFSIPTWTESLNEFKILLLNDYINNYKKG